MPISCPYCQAAINLKETKPGRFTPRCPKCGRKFQLTLPDDPAASPAVAPIASEAETVDAVPVATLPGPAARVAEIGPAIEASREDVPARVGRYRVVRLIGQGATGLVVLARRFGIGRAVALKVMRPDWSRNAVYLARAARDALAASRVEHPNLVAPDDFAMDGGAFAVRMGYVPGASPAARLAPESAVGQVLQAARGLRRAHEEGLVHGDVKPANLIADDRGLLKVADLGLTRTPSVAEVEAAMEAGVTTVTRPVAKGVSEGGAIGLVQAAMGTPAFMAPEQAADATKIDPRADIYSLGCTLFAMLAGRPPFEGSDAVALIARHRDEPIAIPGEVPPALAEIIRKMTAKRPEDRYANMGEVIRALEAFLGRPGTGAFSPLQEDADLIAECAATFRDAPTATLRRRVLAGAAAGCAAMVGLGAMAGQPFLAGGFLGLGLMAALAYFVVTGVRRGSALYDRAVDFLLGGGPIDALMTLAAFALVVTLLFVFHLFWAWLAFGILAVMAAIYAEATIDRKAEAERAGSVESALGLVRRLRAAGIDESAIRQFVSLYSGPHWEEFFEAVFGFDARRDARRQWGRDEQGRRRPRFAPWRDWLAAWMDGVQWARRRDRQRALLAGLEERGLEAQGVNLMTARRRGRRIAEAMVAVAYGPATDAQGAPRPPIGKALRDAALRPEDVLIEREEGPSLGDRLGEILGAVVGPRARFLVGSALLAGFLAWVHQNEIVTRAHLEKLKEAATKAAEAGDVSALRDVKLGIRLDKPTEALRVSMPSEVPPDASRLFRLFNGFHPGVAGLILLVASFFPGTRLGLLAFAGAAVALFGPSLGLPGAVSMAMGAAIGGAGLVLFRGRG